MRIVFVRHGEPNYEYDCLTPLGHLQAEAAAERVKHEGISRIYSSTCGRAYETALHAAEVLQLPVKQLDFMREISWGWVNESLRAHPWTCAGMLLRSDGIEPMRTDIWRQHEYFTPEPLISCVDESVAGFDRLLADHGYVRSGDVYRCVNPSDETIAVYSHCGSSTAVLAHMLNISFAQFCTVCELDFTSVTVIDMRTDRDGLAIPMVEIMNDHRHILNLSK